MRYCNKRERRVAMNAQTRGRLSMKTTASRKTAKTPLTRKMDSVMDSLSRASLAKKTSSLDEPRVAYRDKDY
jgi:hypothetical protein